MTCCEAELYSYQHYGLMCGDTVVVLELLCSIHHADRGHACDTENAQNKALNIGMSLVP